MLCNYGGRLMCGDGKESIRQIRPLNRGRPIPIIIQECPIESVKEEKDPLKQAIEEALGVYRS